MRNDEYILILRHPERNCDMTDETQTLRTRKNQKGSARVDTTRVIQLLKYYGTIDKEIELQAQEIRDAEEICYSVSGVNMDGMPRGKYRFRSPTEETAIRAAQTDAEIIRQMREQLERMKRLRFEIQGELKALPIDERKIIIKKHKDNKGWKEIAKYINYSEKTCSRHYKSAINILAARFEQNTFIAGYRMPIK